MSDETDDLLAEILARPLGEVIAARDETVRRLKREKRTEEAAAIAGLRRPSPPLWAANRLHGANPGALRDLLEAGTRVRAAQAALLGGQADAVQRLTEAGKRFNDAVQRSAHAAQQLLVAEGHGAGVDAERRLQSMLRAAAVSDEQTRSALRAGRLVAEPQPAGFDLLAGAPLGARSPDAAGEAPQDTQEPVADRRERRRELQRAVAERKDAHARAEREAAAHRGRVAALAKEIAELERRAERLRREQESERERAEAAESVAGEARAALDRAHAALDA